MDSNLLKIMQQNMARFSKSQKRIAEYIMNHYDKAAFMTAARLGQTINVSESTVVRFAAELGYDGYPAMQKALQEIIRNKLTAVQRMEVANHRIDEHNVLDTALRSDVDNILTTLNETDKAAFDAVVNSILQSKKIYIIGVRSSAALAEFLGFYFRLIFPNVYLLGTTSTSEIFEQILHISEEDVLIGISFPRYSKRTVKAMQYAQSRGADVVAITDSAHSPLYQYATHKLTARGDMVSFVDSLVAPLSLINALIVAVSMKKNKEISETFRSLEKIWDEYEVYEKFENE